MQIQTVGKILFAVGLSILVGFGVRLLHAPDACSEAALDNVLEGGQLVLPDRCVIYTNTTKIITGDVTILGSGAMAVIVAYYEADAHRVFEVHDGAHLRLENIGVSSGEVSRDGREIVVGGAGILNHGTLELVNSTLANNRTRRGMGAGLYNFGTARITGSSIERNHSLGAPGAGIVNEGQMTIEKSAVRHNFASELHINEMAGFGGGIWNQGELTIVDSDIHDNTASHDVGILNTGQITITHSRITHNTATSPNVCSGSGAGIANGRDATALIEDSTISDNRASKHGGGIKNVGTMTVRNSRVVNNDACFMAGGIMNIFTAHLTVENSVISGNTVDTRHRYGVFNGSNEEAQPTFIGRGNYWGSSDGPGGEGPGSGDGVYGVAKNAYTPWLTQPPDWARE